MFDLASCAECPNIQETVGLGSDNVSDCVCPSSFFDDGGSCLCAIGYGYDVVTDVCSACSDDSIKVVVSFDLFFLQVC